MKYAVVKHPYGMPEKVVFRTDDIHEAFMVKGVDTEKRVVNTEIAKEYAEK